MTNTIQNSQAMYLPIIQTSIFLCAVCSGMFALKGLITANFFHNVWLNSLIMSAVVIGLVRSLRMMIVVWQEYHWIESSEQERTSDDYQKLNNLELLAPIANAIASGGWKRYLSTVTVRSIIDSIESRMDGYRDLSRYLIGLPIFLGLLGTFWGLSQTVVGIGEIIRSINQNETALGGALKMLTQGLQASLSGMGTAFSCSLFGLAGSLIVGFLDIQVGSLFSRLLTTVEEKLSPLVNTLLNSKDQDGLSPQSTTNPALSLVLLEQAAESITNLQAQLKQTEESRFTMTKSIQAFSEKLSQMSEYIVAHQGFTQRLAQNQIELQELMRAGGQDSNRTRSDEIIKTHVRSLDASLSKLLEETIEGRTRSTQDIIQEIRVLTKTLSAIANGTEYTSN